MKVSKDKSANPASNRHYHVHKCYGDHQQENVTERNATADFKYIVKPLFHWATQLALSSKIAKDSHKFQLKRWRD